MSEMETRLKIVERDVERLMNLEKMIHNMDKKLDLISQRKECPNPGACLVLEPRVRSLEDERNKAVGGFKTLVFIGTVTGTAFGWVVSKLTGN